MVAIPADRILGCVSGGTIAAGRRLLPAWVPAIGEIADISINTLHDVRGTDTVTASQFDGWAGAAYAKTYGNLGALVFHTGGHIYLDSNAVYSYDIETRRFRQERPPAQQFLDADRYVGDVETGWMWAANLSTAVQVGEPFAAHTYAWLTWLPPDILPGGVGANGYLYTPGRGSMSQPGQKGTNQPHKYALGSFQPWTFQGPALPQRPTHSFAFLDETRRRVIYGFGDATARLLYWVDPATGATGTITWPVGGGAFKPYYHYGFHATADDVYIMARLSESGFEFSVIDPVALRRYGPPVAGVGPDGVIGDMAIEWVEPWRALVLFGKASNTVWVLKAPPDPRTGAWEWSSQLLTGAVRPNNNPPFTKFRYIEPLQMFVWPSTHNTPLQGFRIQAP